MSAAPSMTPADSLATMLRTLKLPAFARYAAEVAHKAERAYHVRLAAPRQAEGEQVIPSLEEGALAECGEHLLHLGRQT